MNYELLWSKAAALLQYQSLMSSQFQLLIQWSSFIVTIRIDDFTYYRPSDPGQFIIEYNFLRQKHFLLNTKSNYRKLLPVQQYEDELQYEVFVPFK